MKAEAPERGCTEGDNEEKTPCEFVASGRRGAVRRRVTLWDCGECIWEISTPWTGAIDHTNSRAGD